jgi:hypothetical protein
MDVGHFVETKDLHGNGERNDTRISTSPFYFT